MGRKFGQFWSWGGFGNFWRKFGRSGAELGRLRVKGRRNQGTIDQTWPKGQCLRHDVPATFGASLDLAEFARGKATFRQLCSLSVLVRFGGNAGATTADRVCIHHIGQPAFRSDRIFPPTRVAHKIEWCVGCCDIAPEWSSKSPTCAHTRPRTGKLDSNSDKLDKLELGPDSGPLRPSWNGFSPNSAEVCPE